MKKLKPMIWTINQLPFIRAIPLAYEKALTVDRIPYDVSNFFGNFRLVHLFGLDNTLRRSDSFLRANQTIYLYFAA
ncbi:hypothetical protein C8J35_1462 [Rhizobium sp. PP-F2F-G38]|nr:hypothetical protein C8J35_1462 [Rhizobium sp. PP-F2F-G38]